jgi:hypothetical protein
MSRPASDASDCLSILLRAGDDIDGLSVPGRRREMDLDRDVDAVHALVDGMPARGSFLHELKLRLIEVEFVAEFIEF